MTFEQYLEIDMLTDTIGRYQERIDELQNSMNLAIEQRNALLNTDVIYHTACEGDGCDACRHTGYDFDKVSESDAHAMACDDLDESDEY
jgi:hypothetical protein